MPMMIGSGFTQPLAAAGGGITINAQGTHATATSGTSLNYTGITVAAGTNTALIVVINKQDSTTDAAAGLTVVWDSGGTNQSMTLVADNSSGASERGCFIFGLLSPTTGNNTLALSWTNSITDICVDAIALDGVEQASTAAAFPNNATVSATTTTAVTSTSGNYVISSLIYTGAPTSNLRGTAMHNDVIISNIRSAAAYEESAGASVTIGQDNANAFLSGVDVQAA